MLGWLASHVTRLVQLLVCGKHSMACFALTVTNSTTLLNLKAQQCSHVRSGPPPASDWAAVLGVVLVSGQHHLLTTAGPAQAGMSSSGGLKAGGGRAMPGPSSLLQTVLPNFMVSCVSYAPFAGQPLPPLRIRCWQLLH